MLKNVHLAPGWLMQLEKKLHSLQPHACFRLFLTMEINPKVSEDRDSCWCTAWPPVPTACTSSSVVTGTVSSPGACESAPCGSHLCV